MYTGEERRKEKSWCMDHENKISKIETALYGNGHPENGMVWKVTENTKFIEEVKKHWGWMVRIALGGALSAIGLLILQVAKMLVQHGNI